MISNPKSTHREKGRGKRWKKYWKAYYSIDGRIVFALKYLSCPWVELGYWCVRLDVQINWTCCDIVVGSGARPNCCGLFRHFSVGWQIRFFFCIDKYIYINIYRLIWILLLLAWFYDFCLILVTARLYHVLIRVCSAQLSSACSIQFCDS